MSNEHTLQMAFADYGEHLERVSRTPLPRNPVTEFFMIFNRLSENQIRPALLRQVALIQEHGHGATVNPVPGHPNGALRLSIRLKGNSDTWSIQFFGDPNIGTVRVEQSNLHMMSALTLQNVMNFLPDQVTEEAIDDLITEFLSELLSRLTRR